MAGSSSSKLDSKDPRARLASRMRERSEKDYGSHDSVRRALLTYVAEERYDHALQELERYAASKGDYPQFEVRAQRYVTFAKGLIGGIKAKRSFPGLTSLALSKQQELFESAMEHFDELNDALRHVERVEREARLEDIRSTVWVVKAVVYCVSALLVAGFAREVSRGMLPSASIVLDDASSKAANWICEKIGL